MSTAPQLTFDEYRVILTHNARLASGARKAIAHIRQTQRTDRSDIENGMLDYWLHVVQCLTWSTKIAEQMAGLLSDAPS
jgi:hypothetical protein